MADTTTWVQLRADPDLSWHIVTPEGLEAVGSSEGSIGSRCGLWSDPGAPTSDDLPMGGKSCERCCRLHLHDQERAAG